MSKTTTYISGGNAIVSIIMQTSLSKFWSMVNSQQIVVQLPLMEGTKFPANTMMINSVIQEIAEFEIIPSETINEKLFYLPEVDPYTIKFQECGIESRFFLQTMGLPLYIMLVHFALLVIYIFLTLFNVILQSPRLRIITNYLKRYLFWNGFLRLYMELYSGLALSSVLNIHTGTDDENSPFKWV